jgi:uncharacterized protein (DUF779 family)
MMVFYWGFFLISTTLNPLADGKLLVIFRQVLFHLSVGCYKGNDPMDNDIIQGRHFRIGTIHVRNFGFPLF